MSPEFVSPEFMPEALGMTQFVPEGRVFATPAAFQVKAPGEGVWTKYMCLVANARVRRLFRG